jgi:hypothetical protein
VLGEREKRRTFTLPNLLAIDEAGSIERAAMKLVMKNIVPNLLSARLNCRGRRK